MISDPEFRPTLKEVIGCSELMGCMAVEKLVVKSVSTGTVNVTLGRAES